MRRRGGNRPRTIRRGRWSRRSPPRPSHRPRPPSRHGRSMTLGYFAGAAFRAFTTARKGPTLYDLCDPLLAGAGSGDPHLRKFYKRAVANPALRLVLSRAGLPQLKDESRFRALSDAVRAARDEASPDWAAIGRPLAAILDELPQSHPQRAA